MVRWLTAGESHGPALVTIAEGLPAGIVYADSRAMLEDRIAAAAGSAGRSAVLICATT